jgi:outer membrane beta-barrel protein
MVFFQKTEVNVLKQIFKIFIFSLFSLNALASENVDVPTDELTQETVYPIFDNPVSVKNRNIQDSGVLDVGLFAGLAITEPISSTTKMGFVTNYHFNEVHSLGILWAKNSSGLSKDGQGLKDDFGLNFTRAPSPDYTIMGDYNYKAFYGKLSVTKEGVVNTSIYGSAAGGIVKYVHKSFPAVALGLGERFYFGHHWSLKLDLRLFMHQAPIPFISPGLKDGSKPNNNPGNAADPIPSYDSFSERLTYTTNLEIGLNYLF